MSSQGPVWRKETSFLSVRLLSCTAGGVLAMPWSDVCIVLWDSWGQLKLISYQSSSTPTLCHATVSWKLVRDLKGYLWLSPSNDLHMVIADDGGDWWCEPSVQSDSREVWATSHTAGQSWWLCLHLCRRWGRYKRVCWLHEETNLKPLHPVLSRRDSGERTWETILIRTVQVLTWTGISTFTGQVMQSPVESGVDLVTVFLSRTHWVIYTLCLRSRRQCSAVLHSLPRWGSSVRGGDYSCLLLHPQSSRLAFLFFIAQVSNDGLWCTVW